MSAHILYTIVVRHNPTTAKIELEYIERAKSYCVPSNWTLGIVVGAVDGDGDMHSS